MVKKKKSTPKVDVAPAVSIPPEDLGESKTNVAIEKLESEEKEVTTQIEKIEETSTVVDLSLSTEELMDPSAAETPKSAATEESSEALKSNSSLDGEMMKMESTVPRDVTKDSDNKTECKENESDISPIAGEPVPTTIELEKSNDESFDKRGTDDPSMGQLVENVPVEVSNKSSSEASDENEDGREDDDAEMPEATSPNTKQPEHPATSPSTGPKTLFIGNLPYNVDKEKLIEFFKDAGEVVEVRLGFHDDGRSKGYGHVDFATSNELEKALSLNGTSLLGRPLKLDVAHEKGSHRPASGTQKNSTEQKGKRARSQRVFIRGFDNSLPEEQIRSTLMEHFNSCGEIASMSIPMERGTSTVKGIAYIEFNDTESFDKALNLDGTQLGARHLTVQEANPKDENRGGGGGGRSGSGGGSRSGGGGGSRSGGSRRSGGGGGSKRGGGGGDRRGGGSRYGMGHDRFGMGDDRYGMGDGRYGMSDGRYGMGDGRYGTGGMGDGRYGMGGMGDGRYGTGGMGDGRYGTGGMGNGRYGMGDGRFGMDGGQMAMGDGSFGMGGGWFGRGNGPFVGNDGYAHHGGGRGGRGGNSGPGGRGQRGGRWAGQF